MGYGGSLMFIAVGAILAFATSFHISGIDLNMIGLILMGVGAVGMLITIAYTRPRDRSEATEMIDEAVYIEHPDETRPLDTDPYHRR